MKKIITFLLFVAITLNLFAQFANEQANLEKYWLYRQRLKENFLFLSNNNEYGSNIPVSRINPYVIELATGVFDVGHVEYIDWDDCNGALPYYLILLATEYKLLKKYANSFNNNSFLASQTLNELWNAVKAVERLDMFADGVVNGVFRRSDVCVMNRISAVEPEYVPLVNHFDGLNANDELVKIDFREKIWEDWSIYYQEPRFNSQDNVIKFIEAEAVVRALLSDDTATNNVRSKLFFLCKKMLENMYHPNEPRSFWDRDSIAGINDFMNRTWYLKNPEYNSDPDSLLKPKNGGAGDAKTYATSYGFAMSSKRFGLNYNGTDNSYLLFRMLMKMPIGLYSRMEFTKIEFNNCLPNYSLKFVDVTSNYIPIRLGIPSFWFCSETSRMTKSQIINSNWMERTLAAINDINPGIRSTYKYLTDLRENRSAPLDQLPMIWNIIHNNKSQIRDSDRSYIGNLLDIAPRCGPKNLKFNVNTYSYDVYEWSCPNRFVWPELNGSNDTWRHGYFNGIDYMVLHNLYWLTKVVENESGIVYKDQIIENQQKIISSKSEFVYARYSLKLKPGFKLSVSGDYKYVAGTNPEMRSTYDADLPFTKQNVDFCIECDPIFKDNPLKSKFNISENNNDSIDDVQQAKIAIYPNPVFAKITVNSNMCIKSISVKSAAGNALLNFLNINTNSFSFDISTLQNGVYIIKTLTCNGYEENRKIVKNN